MKTINYICIFLISVIHFELNAKTKKHITVKNWDDLQLSEMISGTDQALKKETDSVNLLLKDKVVKNKLSKEVRSVSSEDANLLLSKDYISGDKILVLRDPQLLELIEKKGFSLNNIFNHNLNSESSTQILYKNSDHYKFIADLIRQDLNEMTVSENQNKTLPKAGVGMAYSRRVMDANWFSSEYSRFELVGIINRIDRASFDENTCGETRFIYRLSYVSKIGNYSRLPVTFMLKFTNKGLASQNSKNTKLCKEFAERWVYPDGVVNNSQLVDWLVQFGPLKEIQNKSTLPTAIELNLQAMRIPSKARPDLAGHGTYLLRGFKFNQNGKLEYEFLENTPDVAKIKSNPELKKEFIEQFKDRHFVNQLSEGILKLNDKYLATRAWSYSPYGIARKENRLYDQFLTEDDLKNIVFNQSKYVRNSTAAIMRLNDMSCVGCHQARAHAGFHFLGVDKKTTHPLNALLFEGSGHFELEKQRRESYLRELLEGHWPNPTRDFSISPGVVYDAQKAGVFKEFRKATRGHFCGFSGGPFEHWVCADGLVCQSVDEAVGQKYLGKCYPKEAMAGDPVIMGSLKQDHHQIDQLVVSKNKSCGSLEPKYSFGIFDKSGGFPSGQCYRRNCNGIKTDSKDEVCADSAGAGFNDCIAKTATGKVSFSSCLESTVTHYGFARCSERQACRNDFVCARSVKGEGYCTPSYFLFQIRVDGHIDPIKGL